MTESGFEMPPDHIVSQMLSILDLSAPVIMQSPLLSQFGRASNGIEHFDDEPGEALPCSWHGKVRSMTLRMHFSWPVQYGKPVYVMYIGQKITRR